MKAEQLKNSILRFGLEGKLNNFKENREFITHSINDSLSLNIPNTWEVIKFEDLATIVRGGSPRPISSYITDELDGINWIKIGDTVKGAKYIDQTQQKIKPEGLSKSRLIHKGDFLLSNSMSFGRPYISNITGAIHDGWLAISDYEDKLDKDFLYYLLSSDIAFRQFKALVTGTTVKNLTRDKVKSIYIPLPSIKEQKEIVAKVEELLEKIDQYSELKKKLTFLNKNFPNNMKKSLLQHAVEGKLVPQNTDDEPADILIQRIKNYKEKMIKENIIKKEKPLPPITKDEVPFEIPTSWEWLRLKDLFYNLGQKKPNTPFYYIDVASIDKSKGRLSSNINIISPEDAPSRARKIVRNGTVLYSTVRPYLQNICIVNKDFDLETIASTAFLVMEPIEIYKKYLYYVLKSPFFNTYVENKMAGVAYPAINDRNLTSALIPIPPLEEQRRIVEKIEDLLEYIEKVETVFM